MARDVDAAVARLTRQLQSLTRTVHALRAGSRTQRLPHSSLETGQSIELVDGETGASRGRIGWQSDGTVAIVTEGGDPPPAPTAPTVAAAPLGLMVQWDGALANGVALPADLDHVSVHVSPTSGLTPSSATFQGTIPRAGGLFPVVPLEVDVTYYAVLVPVTTGGIEGAPSVEASGVPEGVGGVPGPGSITETEIADNAISTPKLQALAVTAAKIAANSIEAGHITAGAVTAAKLAAEIVLGTRIIAGTPGAGRTELDEFGLRKYNSANELQIVFEGDDAIFSGTVTASEIVGSRMELGTIGVATGEIQDQGGVVQARVTSATDARAQLSASSTQAEFSAFGDVGVTTTPVAAFIAQPGTVQMFINSDNSTTTSPAVVGAAGSVNAYLTVSSSREAGAPAISSAAFASGVTERWSSGAAPEAQVSATPGAVTHRWQADADTAITITATTTTAQMGFSVPAPAAGSTPASPGSLYAFRSSSGDQPQVAIQSPYSTSGTGAQRRASITLTGAQGATYPTARILAYANEVLFGNDFDALTSAFSTDDGRVRLASTHSITASRHAFAQTVMLAAPTGNGSGGNWIAFTSGQYPTLPFKTGASGRVRVVIAMCAVNYVTQASTIAVSFALNNGGPAADGLRCAMVRSTGATASNGGRQQEKSVYLTLTPNTSYVLTPYWRTNDTGAFGTGKGWDLGYDNSITVEPLM
jgi:hypothetical protein